MYINNLNVKEIDSSTLEQETCKKFNELQTLQSILKRLKLKLRDKDKNYSKYKRFHDNILSIIQFRVSNDSITREGASANEIEYNLISENSIVINDEQLVLEDATHLGSPKSGSTAGSVSDENRLFPEHRGKPESHSPAKAGATKEEGDIPFNVELVDHQKVVKINEHVYLPLEYYNRLYLHQKKALNWLVKLHVNNLGGILADDMGLGKTITILALVNALIFSNNLILRRAGGAGALLASSAHYQPLPAPDQRLRPPAAPLLPTAVGDDVCRMLIVCNVTLIEQWRSEINKWVFNDVKLYILHSNYDVNVDYFAPSEDAVYRPKTASSSSGGRAGHANTDDDSSFINGDPEHAVSYIVYLVGYEYLRINVEFINNYDWAYLILDEGQKIRNPNALITLAVKTINTPHRIVVSGSPIQNNLIELWSLVDFILPNYLGSLNAFIEEFVAPISGRSLNNRHVNRLKLLILPYIFRTLKSGLGAKRDLLSAITSGAAEDARLEGAEDAGEDPESLFGPSPESHPETPGHSQNAEDESSDKKEVELPNKVERIILCNLTVEQYRLYIDVLNKFKYSNKNLPSRGYKLTRDVRKLVGKELTRDKHVLKVIGVLRKICNHPQLLLKSPLPAPGSVDHSVSPFTESTPGNTGAPSTSTQTIPTNTGVHSTSSKLNVCLKIIGIWRAENCKILVFTQTISMLSIIYHELLRSYQSHQVAVLHGKIGISARNKVIDDFRNDEQIFVMLLTTKVGGIGLNLTVATRIIIYDPDWNPMTDLQARERSYRIGQRRQVVIYRLITAHTIEEKIYQRQLYKCYLTNKILNYSNVVFYNRYINNLQYILSYPPPPSGAVSTNPLFRDFGPDDAAASEHADSEPSVGLPSRSPLGEDEDQFYRLLLTSDQHHNINSYIRYNDVLSGLQEGAENNSYPALASSPLPLATPAAPGVLARGVDRNRQLLRSLRGRSPKSVRYILTNQILHFFGARAGERVTTNQLITYFRPILPDEYHKLFKSTLKQLCTLVKSDKSSHWKLNEKYLNVLPNYIYTMHCVYSIINICT